MPGNDEAITYLEQLAASMENVERAADKDNKTPVEGRFDNA